MNDSPYGLTASIWTNAEKNPESQDAFLRLVDELHTGTVFLNRQIHLIHLKTVADGMCVGATVWIRHWPGPV